MTPYGAAHLPGTWSKARGFRRWFPAVGFLPFCLFLLLFLPACRPESSEEALTLAVAANATPLVQELAVIYHRQSGRRVEVISGSSGKLSTQIQQGAPYDLFLSADMGYPRDLVEQGHAIGPVRAYAEGRLVLWARDSATLRKRGMTLLLDPAVERIAMAQPRLAPYGRAAQQALRHLGWYESLSHKLVFGESVSQVNQFLTTGAVEAGFTAASALLLPALAPEGGYLELAPPDYQPIEQGIVITAHGAEKRGQAARGFLEFMRSAAAEDALLHYGYRIPQK